MLGHVQTRIDHTGGWVGISVAMVVIAGFGCWVVGKSGGLACTVMGLCVWQGEREGNVIASFCSLSSC